MGNTPPPRPLVEGAVHNEADSTITIPVAAYNRLHDECIALENLAERRREDFVEQKHEMMALEDHNSRLMDRWQSSLDERHKQAVALREATTKLQFRTRLLSLIIVGLGLVVLALILAPFL